MANNELTQFKIVLVGNGGVGKTCYCKKFLTQGFEKKYVATLGVEVHPIHFTSNYGKIVFNVWDTAGQEKYGGLRDGYYIKGNGALAFYEEGEVVHVNEALRYAQEVKRVCGDIPLFYVSTKNDEGCACEGPCLHISAKNNINLNNPFLALARTLMGKNDLVFLEQAPLQPYQPPPMFPFW